MGVIEEGARISNSLRHQRAGKNRDLRLDPMVQPKAETFKSWWHFTNWVWELSDGRSCIAGVWLRILYFRKSSSSKILVLIVDDCWIVCKRCALMHISIVAYAQIGLPCTHKAFKEITTDRKNDLEDRSSLNSSGLYSKLVKLLPIGPGNSAMLKAALLSRVPCRVWWVSPHRIFGLLDILFRTVGIHRQCNLFSYYRLAISLRGPRFYFVASMHLLDICRYSRFLA